MWRPSDTPGAKIVLDAAPKTFGPQRQTARAVFSTLLLVLQPILFFWRVLINPTAHIPFDIEGFHLPLLSYIAQCVRRGIAPLWDPYPYCGVPIHADPQAQLFYPFTWLTILAGNYSEGRNLFYWVQWQVPFHMMLAGLFALALLRRMRICWPAAVLGASVYQLGSYFASQAQHLGAICTAPWLPLAVLAVFEMKTRVRVRWVAVLAIAIGMSILAGFPATALIVCASVLLTAIALAITGPAGCEKGPWEVPGRGKALAAIGGACFSLPTAFFRNLQASWRIFPAMAAGFLAGTVIAAVELIPLWELSRSSMASLRSTWTTTGGGLPWQALVSLVVPNHYSIFDFSKHYSLPFNFTFLYIYSGIVTLVLLLLAPFVRKSYARVFLMLTIVSVFWMLGGRTPVYSSIFVLLPGMIRGALYAEYASMAFCFFAGITAAIVLDRFGKRLPHAVLWGIALFTSYDLITTGKNRPMNSASGSYKTGDSEYGPANYPSLSARLHRLVNRTVPPSRIDYADGAFPQGIHGSEMLALPTANGDNPLVLRRMLRLRRLVATGNPWDRKLLVNRLESPLLSMMNVEWIVSGSALPGDQVNRAGLDLVDSANGIQVYRNPRVLPRFFFVSRIRRSTSEDETFRMLAQASFDPSEEAIVEGVPGDSGGLATGEVHVTQYSPNRVKLGVAATGPAFLATSEVMYTGWQARVNGKPHPILMTNGAFRGLFVPAGTSEIVMEYHPANLGFALFLSLISFVGAAGVALNARRWKSAVSEAASRKEAMVEWLTLGGSRLRNMWTMQIVPRQLAIGSVFLLLLATVLFYWRILLTGQFSLLTESEGVAQAYSWLRFWTAAIRHGTLPIWDPFTLAGHSFVGEMQTAAFYPLHLLLALFPPNRDGLLSPNLYHVWFAFAHFLGACFMFALAREFKLSRFAAFIAGICFSLGGFVARMGWPHMLESSIWLPLLFLFFLRAIRAADLRLTILNSALGGLVLGLSILAGGMHVVILQVLIIVSASIYHGFTSATDLETLPRSRRQSWVKAAIVVLVIGAVGLAAGAVQLLPSIEYSQQAIRFLGKPGPLPANEKIPYDYLSDGLWPHSFIAMLIPQAFNGNLGSGEVANPYIGVFPLLLAILGIRRHWENRWVRYLTGLALAAFLYSLGALSPLHGWLYAIVPRLWMAREAGRIVYIVDFSLAILAPFGVNSLFSRDFATAASGTLNRVLAGVVIACAAILFVPAVFGRPEINPHVALSLVLILLSYALYRSIARGNTGSPAKLLVSALILFDLSAFDWTARNRLEVARASVNHLDRLLSCRGAVQFLKSQPKPFRVEIAGYPKPNIGDALAIETTAAAGVTLPIGFTRIGARADLLNVRYRLAPAETPEPGAIYQDSAWKIYENPNAYPRAWIVHDAVVEPSPERGLAQLDRPGFDPRRTAVLDKPAALEPLVKHAQETVTFVSLEQNRLELNVHTQSRALLVISEMFYPGWYARVDGRPAPVYRANVALRGVVVPPGESRIVLSYEPWSVYIGAVLTLMAFCGVLAGWRHTRRSR